MEDEVLIHLKPLIGLKLSIARRAADLRNFQFGEIRAIEKGTVGEYALHIQCPWRLDGPDGIITGRFDLWQPSASDQEVDWETWDYEKQDNLQDKLIGAWLGSYDPQTRSFINTRDDLTVEAVHADSNGGATIELSGGYRLLLFPAGARGEDWRLFRPTIDEPHFVIAGGKIEPET